MNIEQIFEYLFKLGSALTSLALVGKFILSAYKKLVIDPQNRMMRETLMPINTTLERLNIFMVDSKLDRVETIEINKCQDITLGEHHTRIRVLEEWKDDHKTGHSSGYSK